MMALYAIVFLLLNSPIFLLPVDMLTFFMFEPPDLCYECACVCARVCVPVCVCVPVPVFVCEIKAKQHIVDQFRKINGRVFFSVTDVHEASELYGCADVPS